MLPLSERTNEEYQNLKVIDNDDMMENDGNYNENDADD